MSESWAGASVEPPCVRAGRELVDRKSEHVRTSWRQQTVHKVVAARPLVRATDGRRRVVRYEVKLARGSALELGAEVVCERLSNKHREQIVLTVDRAAHVLERHMRGDLTAVFAPGLTLTRLLRLFCRHHRERLSYGPDSHKLSVVCDQVIGTSSVASATALLERGIVSERDIQWLAERKAEVFNANVYGSDAEQSALVALSNRELRDRNVRLADRSGVVLPAFIAPPAPTRSFVVVLDRPRGIGPSPDDEKQIRTMYPGELLCDSPAHDRYMPGLSVSDLPAGLTIGALQRKHDAGQALGEREETVLRSYRHSFEVWYEHGFIAPKPPGRASPRRAPWANAGARS